MIHLITNILVKNKTPEEIFDFMKNMDKEKYIRWHPKDHKDYKWIIQTKTGKYSLFYFNEIFGSLHLNWIWILTADHIPTFFKAQAILPYPIYLTLTLKKVPSGTEVIHTVKTGFNFFGIEKFFDWFVNSFVFTKINRAALDKHATEEFKNLEKIL